MRKFLMFLLLVLVLIVAAPAAAGATSWQTANQMTIEWDVVTGKNPGDAIAYNVYLKNAVTGTQVLNGEVASTSVLLTFITEGQFYAGVSTVRKVDLNLDGKWDTSDVDVDGNPVIMESAITWSNSTNPVEVPDPFGARWFVAPTNPMNFGVK